MVEPITGPYCIRMVPDVGERMSRVKIVREGIVPFATAFALQQKVHAERVAGERPDTLILLSHPPVVTLGRGAHDENLLLSAKEYRERGVEVHETDRGGDVTYHGPGQLVGYPIVDLRGVGLGPRSFLRLIEESLIRLLATYGVAAGRVPGLTGVWVGDEKVAAIGIRISRGVSLHGFALNVTTDPAEFDLIVPCGIRDRGVTSLARLTREPVDVESVADRFGPVFADTLYSGPSSD